MKGAKSDILLKTVYFEDICRVVLKEPVKRSKRDLLQKTVYFGDILRSICLVSLQDGVESDMKRGIKNDFVRITGSF